MNKLRSLQKVISKPLPFSGTYEETSVLYNGSFTPSIPQTLIPSSRMMDVYVGGLVKLRSDYFLGKAISISGPYSNYYRAGSQIWFTLNSLSGACVTVTVSEEGCDDEVQLKFFPCIMLDLNITPTGSQTYELSVTRNEVSERTQENVSAEKDSSRLIDEPWTLEVTNAVSGRNALSRNMDEPVYLLNTAGWEPGVSAQIALHEWAPQFRAVIITT